jgi:hypothetical protein
LSFFTTLGELVERSKKAAPFCTPAISPSGPERHRLDVSRLGERGEDHAALRGERSRGVGPGRASLQMMAGRLPMQIVHDQLVAGLLQIGRHLGSHHAEPDKSDDRLIRHDAHSFFPSTSTV